MMDEDCKATLPYKCWACDSDECSGVGAWVRYLTSQLDAASDEALFNFEQQLDSGSLGPRNELGQLTEAGEVYAR